MRGIVVSKLVMAITVKAGTRTDSSFTEATFVGVVIGYNASMVPLATLVRGILDRSLVIPRRTRARVPSAVFAKSEANKKLAHCFAGAVALEMRAGEIEMKNGPRFLGYQGYIHRACPVECGKEATGGSVGLSREVARWCPRYRIE